MLLVRLDFRECLEELFLVVTEAYHALSNPGKRRRYDGKLQQKKVTERPIPKPGIAAVSDSGETMPQKSTYFFPKLLTGGAFHTLTDG